MMDLQGLHEQGGRAVKHASAFPGLATWRKWPWLGQNWKCMESYGIRPWTSYRIASKSALAAEHSKVHLRYETHQWINPHLHLYLSHSIPSFFSLPYSCGILFLAHTHTCTHSCTHSHDYLKCTLTKQNCIAIPAHLLAGGPSHVYLSVMWSSLAQKEQEIYTTRGGEV